MTDAQSETVVGHCKADSTDVYIGRGPDGRDMTEAEVGERGWLGNPYTLEDADSRMASIKAFEATFLARLNEDEEFRDAVQALSGKTLGCWCQKADEDGPPCHGQVIAKHADRLPADAELVTDGGRSESAIPHDVPPYEAYFVVEVDLEYDRDEPLYVSTRGPFPTREKAEHEKEEQKAAWDRALEEWDNGNPYDFKGWQVVEKHIWDNQIDRLQRQDEESHRITQQAAGAVGASLLAEEGIGPMAGDDDA